MKTDIQTELTQVLLPHEKVWANEEKTILAKNILLDLVEKTDPTIIGLLLSNDELKRHFFVEVNGVLVFKLTRHITRVMTVLNTTTNLIIPLG